MRVFIPGSFVRPFVRPSVRSHSLFRPFCSVCRRRARPERVSLKVETVVPVAGRGVSVFMILVSCLKLCKKEANILLRSDLLARTFTLHHCNTVAAQALVALWPKPDALIW